MANVQKYFEKYHDAIRVDYDSSRPLREKRDIILDKIRKHLQDNKRQSFDELLQGSYILKTGVKPIGKLVHDIDVGLRFEVDSATTSATEVRKWVYEAVENHTDEVKSKGPCIRVTYSDGFHVDLVMYAVNTVAGVQTFKLAHKDKGWRNADPQKLRETIETVMDRFKGTEDTATKTNQFRRLARYLHRWDDVAIPYESAAKPCGLAFVLLIKNCVPTKVLAGVNDSDDLAALLLVTGAVKASSGRICAYKPTPEYEDVFGQISDDDMKKLKDRFSSLHDSLIKARDEKNERKACQILREKFGSDFPVPEEAVTKESLFSAPFVPSSGMSFPNVAITPPNKPGQFA
jgi:hypothetical protein